MVSTAGHVFDVAHPCTERASVMVTRIGTAAVWIVFGALPLVVLLLDYVAGA